MPPLPEGFLTKKCVIPLVLHAMPNSFPVFDQRNDICQYNQAAEHAVSFNYAITVVCWIQVFSSALLPCLSSL